MELGLLGWVGDGCGSECVDGPAGGAGDVRLVVVLAGVGASRHAAAGGGGDRIGASAGEAGSKWLAEMLAEGAGGVSLVAGPAWVGAFRTTAAWGGGDRIGASTVEAGGELLDAGPTGAGASRPIAAGGGGGRVLEPTEGAGSDAGPAGWAGRVVLGGAVHISGNFPSLLASEWTGVHREGSPASVLSGVRGEVRRGEGVICGGVFRA